MEPFKIQWKSSAVKELQKLPQEIIRKIHHAVEDLGQNPHPYGSKKLVGSENGFRIRLGDYRIIYTITSKTLTIEIVRIGHRKNVYK